MINKRDNTFGKRFALSFTLILILPVVFFSFLFLNNYRQLYQDEVLKQAQNVLDGTMTELDKELENLHSIVSYNSLLAHVKSSAVVKDVTGKEIIRTLAAETATHPILEDIEYYNEERPEQLFTAKGLWSLKFYVPLWMGEAEESAYIQQFKGIEKSGWIVQREDDLQIKRLQYVIKDENTGWWRFNISLNRLKEILHEDETETQLLDANGVVCYMEQSGREEYENCYILEAEDPEGIFKLTRTIDKAVLFREVEAWQNYFFLLVALLLLIGGVLILSLTYYNTNTLYELQDYYKKTIKNIPSTVKGFEIFSYSMKKMEEQVALLENKHRINNLLLRLILGRNCETKEFLVELKKDELFQSAEYYRVILIMLQKDSSYNKLGAYISNFTDRECEMHLLDTALGNTSVMVVGMTAKGEKCLESKLYTLADSIRENLNDEVRFFIGDRCRKYENVHLSYKTALISNRNCVQKSEVLVYYIPPRKEENEFLYPDNELKVLYDALVNAELDTADIVTDELTDILRKQSSNRFVSISLYYDILNTYYKAQLKLEMEINSVFVDMDLLEGRENTEMVQMILQIREYFRMYVESVKAAEKECVMIPRVIAYIDANCRSGDISVSTVADHFDVSISNLSHQFKAQTGQNISDYITGKRFEYAAELLQNTDYSVKVIAETLGYSQSANFSRKFRQHYGVTPVEYRNHGKNNLPGYK